MALKLVAKQNRSEGSLKELNSIRPSFSLAGHIRASMYEFTLFQSIGMELESKNWGELVLMNKKIRARYGEGRMLEGEGC